MTNPKICDDLGIEPEQKIYFHKDNGDKKVYEIVNFLLTPYGFENFTEGQFKRIAGGSSISANLIKNYATGRGAIINGYTYIKDIMEYCNYCLKNSIFIPIERVIEEFNWAKKAINNGYITLYSGRGKRYDIEGIIDITKGLLAEVAFEIDGKEHGWHIKLNRDFYEGKTTTDEGQDVKGVSRDGRMFRKPKCKIQIKDVQYFLLIPFKEFYGSRRADIFIGYKTHWQKEFTAQRFFRSLGGKGEDIFDDFPPLDGIRVERRGWAIRSDFSHLPPGEVYKGNSFNDDNMFVYWEELRDIGKFFHYDLL